MISLLRTRRSVRKFTGQPVEPEKLDLLKEAALRSPTSKNSNACEFIFIDNPAIIKILACCKPTGASPLLNAPLVVVVLASESQTIAWVEDCSIASIILQLTAHSLGLGSCWVQIRRRDYSEEKTSETFVRQTLNIPVGYRVLSCVAIGYSQRQPEGKPFGQLDFSKIHLNGL